MLKGRTDGPLTLRLLLQPTVATVLAVRAGLKDAREGRPPYLWTIFTDRESRRSLLREGWKDVGKVFTLALVLDVVYSLIVYRWIYPTQSLLVAATLALVPYLLFRGPVNRLFRRRFVRA